MLLSLRFFLFICLVLPAHTLRTHPAKTETDPLYLAVFQFLCVSHPLQQLLGQIQHPTTHRTDKMWVWLAVRVIALHALWGIDPPHLSQFLQYPQIAVYGGQAQVRHALA